MEKNDLCTIVAGWILLLQEYNYEIEYCSGSSMKHVDSLGKYLVMMIRDDWGFTRIKQVQSKDEELQTILNILKDRDDYDGYFTKGNILYNLVDGYEVIVAPRGMQKEIIQLAHENGNLLALLYVHTEQ